MEVREYFETKEKILRSIGGTYDTTSDIVNCAEVKCEDCPFNLGTAKFKCLYYRREGIEVVEKWLAEHPKRTYKDMFLEVFPDAKLNDDGNVPFFCPSHIGLAEPDDHKCPFDCVRCWSQEYIESDGGI